MSTDEVIQHRDKISWIEARTVLNSDVIFLFFLGGGEGSRVCEQGGVNYLRGSGSELNVLLRSTETFSSASAD